MNFKGDKPIYLQIADMICEKIASGEWEPGDRISSVRNMGGELEVNPNTVMRSYEWLSEREIIYNTRGVGFFVAIDALQRIQSDHREKLLNSDLRDIARRMKLLGITIEEVEQSLLGWLSE